MKFLHLWKRKLCREVKRWLHWLHEVFTFLAFFKCFLELRWISSCLGPEAVMLQVKHLSSEIGLWRGDEGGELTGVVDVDSTSPPSPSLSIAESSINLYFFLEHGFVGGSA